MFQTSNGYDKHTIITAICILSSRLNHQKGWFTYLIGINCCCQLH